MNNLMVFENNNFGAVRAVEINGKPYFVGKDIAGCLGYSNTNDAINRHCKGVVFHEGLKVNGIKVALISEGDIYRLIMKSKLPAAEKFESWVMDEVLPEIRKTGGYIPSNENDSEADIVARALLIVNRKLEEKTEENKVLKGNVMAQAKIIDELKPKAESYDTVCNSKNLLTTSQIAQDFGMSAQQLNKILHDLGVQYKQNGQWLTYAKYKNLGLKHSTSLPKMRSDGNVIVNTSWTMKGKIFIHDLLRKYGIVSIVERVDISERTEQLSF